MTTQIEREYGRERWVAEVDDQGRIGRLSQMPLTADPKLVETFREFLAEVTAAMREAR